MITFSIKRLQKVVVRTHSSHAAFAPSPECTSSVDCTKPAGTLSTSPDTPKPQTDAAGVLAFRFAGGAWE
jgi:hypothetical protein